MKRLSVIIPGYNTPNEWWRRCINSVLAACGENDEVICVDDGSTKKPDVKFEDARVRWICLEKNIGQAAARNIGLENASGEYVAFVDSDDAVKNDVFNLCIGVLDANGADVALFGVECIWFQENLAKTDIPSSCEACEPSAEQVEAWYKGCLLNYVSNKVIRKCFLDKRNIRFDVDGMPCEDIIFYLEILIAGARWCALPIDGYVYYRHSMTSVAHYKACHLHGTAKCAETWQRFSEKANDKDGVCAYHGSLSQQDLLLSEWDNIWRAGSPYSLAGKYGWLRNHASSLYVGSPTIYFVRKLIFSILRRWLYIKPIRVWHLKRVFPNIEPF